MKFYYNGKLVRTSKTHEYKFAAMDMKTGGVFKCSATYEGAYSEITRRINWRLEGIENCKSAIEAIKAGRSHYEAKDGRRSYRITVKGHTVEDYASWMAGDEEALKYYRENLKVVELEAREK